MPAPFDTPEMLAFRQKLVDTEAELQAERIRKAVQRMELEGTPIPENLRRHLTADNYAR